MFEIDFDFWYNINVPSRYHGSEHRSIRHGSLRHCLPSTSLCIIGCRRLPRDGSCRREVFDVATVEVIRDRIRKLYEAGEEIHININMTHPKLVVHNVSARIEGVYPNLFIIEERNFGFPRRHSLSYSDVLIKQIEILELRLGNDDF